MLEWADLIQTVTRRRATSNQTPRGAIVNNWTTIPAQAIQGLIQPYSGRHDTLEFLPEGTQEKKIYILYCNPVTKPGGAVTDVLADDQVVDAKGKEYKVEYNDDEGGQGDHYRVLLTDFGA